MTDIKNVTNAVLNATGKVVDAGNTEAPYVTGFFAKHPAVLYGTLAVALIGVLVVLAKIVF
jgi:hypothetical protein